RGPCVCSDVGAPGGLEQLDDVAGGVFEQDLQSAGAGYDLIAKFRPGRLEPLDLACEVLDDELNAVPAAGTRASAVGHRTAGRALGAAQKESALASPNL